LGGTQRNARERAGTTTTRSYRTESGHNKLLGFSQTSTGASSTASTSVTHQYDAAGNLQTDGLHQYHYDSQGRLQSSQTGQGPDAPTTRYAHNALGQRVFKTEPLFAAASGKDGALDDEEEDPSLLQTLVDFFTRLWNPAKSEAEHLGWAYVYDEDGSLLGEYGMGGAASAGQSQYLYLPTPSGPIPIAAELDGRLYAIHTDHLGTPRRLTQANGQAAWQWAYSAYGDEAPTLGAKRFTNETTSPSTGATNIPPVRFNLRYPGQYFDEESGLHYNYFRSYDPRTGRYTQGDPIGLDGGWNRFSYAQQNPLFFTDPDGLQALLERGRYNPNDVRGGFDQNGMSLVYHPRYYDPGAASKILLLGALTIATTPGWSVAQATEMCTVTSWAGRGIIPDLNAGRWVIPGEATSWNYFKTGLWGPQFSAQRGLFWETGHTAITGEVASSSVVWPGGINWFRGLFGQRIIKP
jgi:RHS repeat-associated protein